MGVHDKSLNLPFSFAVNLKLFSKKLKKKRKKERIKDQPFD